MNFYALFMHDYATCETFNNFATVKLSHCDLLKCVNYLTYSDPLAL